VGIILAVLANKSICKAREAFMHWTIEFDEPQGYFRIVRRGDFTPTEHQRMIEDLVSRPEWRPGAAALFDCRQVRFGDIGFNEVLEVKSIHVSNDARIGDGKSAILMKSDGDYGLGRQFQNLTRGWVSAQIHIFVDEAEAVAWLLEHIPATR
jgi:hypothetical protein